MTKKLSRNAPCPCGSGKKYKACCLRKGFKWTHATDGTISREVFPERAGMGSSNQDM
ncbi:SEC-C metal-binding domain-containing protein [Planctomycetota bacterium]